MRYCNLFAENDLKHLTMKRKDDIEGFVIKQVPPITRLNAAGFLGKNDVLPCQ